MLATEDPQATLCLLPPVGRQAGCQMFAALIHGHLFLLLRDWNEPQHVDWIAQDRFQGNSRGAGMLLLE